MEPAVLWVVTQRFRQQRLRISCEVDGGGVQAVRQPLDGRDVSLKRLAAPTCAFTCDGTAYRAAEVAERVQTVHTVDAVESVESVEAVKPFGVVEAMIHHATPPSVREAARARSRAPRGSPSCWQASPWRTCSPTTGAAEARAAANPVELIAISSCRASSSDGRIV